MRHLVFSMFVVVAVLSSPAKAGQEDLHISFRGENIGTVEEFRVVDVDGQRATVRLVATFPSFAQVLDRTLQARGNLLDRCSRRLFWIGGTSIRDAGSSLGLSSSVRYEQWLCTRFGDTRLGRVTGFVEWRLSVEPGQRDLTISGHVENIRGLQNDLEGLLGLRVRESVSIPLPCTQAYPAVENIRFSVDDAVRIAVTFSVNGDLLNALECL